MKKNKRKRINLSTQWSNIYVIVTLVFFLGFGFFLSSKVFLADKLDILNTEIDKEFNLNGNKKFTIKEWIYDEKDNEMQVTLVTSGLTSYLSDLDFKSVARIDIQDELPTEIKYSSNDIYIVNISEVPKNFEQVALRLVKDEVDLEEVFEEETKNKKEDSVITSIYADQNVVKHEPISEEKVNDYAVQVTNEMIDSTKKEIQEYQKEIEKNNIIIEKINEEISELKGELIYQTIDEQTETNNQIYSLEDEIESKNDSNKEIETNIKAMEIKIERLNQRKTDLEY
jgi:vacuolar-type H+-ATPase subunit I/STV1